MIRRSKLVRQTYFPLLELPGELLHQTCSFLGAHDAVSLSQVSQDLFASFHLALLPPTPLFSRMGWMGHPTNGEEKHESIRLPVMLKRHVHSVRFEFKWRDQGWGNRKGDVWVIAKKSGAETDQEGEFHGGRVVFASMEPAPHTTSNVVVWITPRSGEEYHLWYKAGSGGGHSLHLEDGKLQLFVHDDVEWNLRSNYSALLKAEIIPIKMDQLSFYPKLLMTVVESLVRQQEEEGGGNVDSQIVAMLRDYNLPTTLSGLGVMLDILHEAQALVDREDKEPLPPSTVRAPDPPPNLRPNREVRLGRMVRLQRQPPLHAGGGIPPGGAIH